MVCGKGTVRENKMNHLFEQFRVKRQEIYERTFSAGALCITGAVIMPAFLFNPNTKFRVIQFVFFLFLVWLSGKKNNPFFTLLAAAGIVAFNLIIPYGRVLFSIGSFKITAGALTAGIHRAVTFEGLIMLSKVMIRQDLKIPGVFGELLSESLRIFSCLIDRKQRITGRNLIVEIDRLMLELSGEELPCPAVSKRQTGPAGYIILAIVIFLSWFPLIEQVWLPPLITR
jgi:heptaprenyl diphosphate synthase